MRVLHLTLKKKWFDMIASGEKKEEYRDLKIFWANRLCNKIMCDHLEQHLLNIEPNVVFKDFDLVTFRHGYAKDAPTITLECEGIEIGHGLMVWGAEQDKKYFIIKLGKVVTQCQPDQHTQQIFK